MSATTTQHTPGPWRQPVRYSPEDGQDIPCGAIEDRDGKSIAVCTYDQEPTITAANARLIAAAPDLLQACKETVQAMDTAMTRDLSQIPAVIVIAWNNLRAAIAKAEGHDPESCSECGAPFNDADAPRHGKCPACSA